MGRKKGSKNKSVQDKILHEGQYYTIKNLAKTFNVDVDDLNNCIAVKGMRPSKAIKECQKIKKENFHKKINVGEYNIDGILYNLKQWAIVSNVNYKSLRYHVIKKKRSIKESITRLKRSKK